MNIEWWAVLAMILTVSALIEMWGLVAIVVGGIIFLVFRSIAQRKNNKTDHVTDHYEGLSKPRSPNHDDFQ